MAFDKEIHPNFNIDDPFTLLKTVGTLVTFQARWMDFAILFDRLASEKRAAPHAKRHRSK